MAVLRLDPRAVSVAIVDGPPILLAVRLADGRVISFPLEWSPRLLRATPVERVHYELVAGGAIVRWPDVDEDIEVAGLLALTSIVVPPDGDLTT